MTIKRARAGHTSMGGRIWLGAAALGIAGGLAWFWATERADPDLPPAGTAERSEASRLDGIRQGPSGRPTKPPIEGHDEPFALPQPEPPDNMEQVREEAYADAVRRRNPHPAEAAFRRATDAFVEHNRQFADAQAQQEGLTLDEVKELTFFGFMAQQTQRWPEVEQILGHPLDDATRAAGEQLLHELNAEFKSAMRALVKSGATENERWQLIHDVQTRYREAYFATTGMNQALLDDLLAGDLGRKYPMSQSPPPESLAEQAPAPAEPPPRPDDAPPAESMPPEDEPKPETDPSE